MDSSYLIQAILQCEQALENKLNDSENWQAAFRNLGNLLQGMGQFDRAIVWHSLALEHEPNLVEAYSQLGELYIVQENWQSALASFQKALKYRPNSVQIHSHLAQIYAQLGQREAEMESWYQATQINPDLVNSNGYYKLAKALEQKGKIPEAMECYEKARQGKKMSIPANYDLATIYLRQGKLEQAINCYQDILTVEPNEARAQYKLGTIYLQQQRCEEAIDCFRQTIKNSPDFPWAYRDLVKTFLQLQKWDEAIATCYAIINLVEPYPWVYVQLGNALRKKGRVAEAVTNFQQACGIRGWQECPDHGYFFTQDIFSYRIPIWQEHLQPLFDRGQINALEVGCYQGMSACWLLDRLLTHPLAKLTCIEPNFDRKLRENITKTKAESKVNFLEGDVHQSLASLTPNSFDLLNLQDKCKLTNHIQQDVALAWKLLKVGGVAIFNDYGWTNPAYPEHNPQQGIDHFLNTITGQWVVIHQAPQAYQLIIRKQ